jgi:hypothetical protein
MIGLVTVRLIAHRNEDVEPVLDAFQVLPHVDADLNSTQI